MQRRRIQGPVGSWWSPASPDEVRTEQRRVETSRAALNAGLESRAPTGEPGAVNAAVTAWNLLDAQIAAYTSEEPSVWWWTRDEQLKRGQNYEVQIEAWRKRFGSLGASVPESSLPQTPPSSDPLSVLANVGDVVKWVALAYVASQLLGKGGILR
jgi:hypothetical protein